MVRRVIRFVGLAVMLALAIAAGRWGYTLQAQSSAGVQALEKANVLERLVERTAKTSPTAGTAPSFVLDAAWPKVLPHNWVIGDVGGLYVDSHDHVWVYHRARALSSTDSGALGPAGKNAKGQTVSGLGHNRPERAAWCCTPAPSVLQFDMAGNLLQAWGGPQDPGFIEKRCRTQDGCYWPGREHGIFVDHNENVYITGNGEIGRGTNAGEYPWAANFGGDDSHILKFRADGTFVFQIGTQGMKAPNSNDTNGGVNGTPQVYLPADMTVDPKTNVLYIADGYGNRRVLMVNADTGKYIGHFGAYGQNPVVGESSDPAYGGAWVADYKAGRTKPQFFRNPLHGTKLSNDGFLYVADRGNNRVQVFRTSDVGKPCTNPNAEAGRCGFVKEVNVAPQTIGGTSGSIALSTDPGQTCLYVADLTNFTIYVLNRENLTELGRIGTGGRQAGTFHWPHTLSVDSQGNVYVGEVDTAGRIQKFLRYGSATCGGTGNANVGQYLQN